jgi:hypothetical protein
MDNIDDELSRLGGNFGGGGPLAIAITYTEETQLAGLNLYPGDAFYVNWFWRAPQGVVQAEAEVRVGDQIVAKGVGEPETYPIEGRQLLVPGRGYPRPKELYQIGENAITVVVRDPQSGAKAIARELVPIQLPPLDSWWEWLYPPVPPPWKQEYTVGGRLTNSGKATISISKAWMREQELDEQGALRTDVPITNFTTFQGSIPPGFPVSVEATSLKQDWTWLMNWPGTYEKEFRYSLELWVEDEFGNRYPPLKPDSKTLRISVSNKKRWFARGQAALLGVSVGTVVTAVAIGAASLIPIGLAAAGVIPLSGIKKVTGAIGARLKADDPIEPDYTFDDPAESSQPERLRATDDKYFDGIAEGLYVIDAVLLAIDDLGRAEGRWLAAKMQDADTAAIRQFQEQRRHIERLVELEPRLQRSVDDLFELRWPYGERVAEHLRVWQQSGLPPEMRAVWTENDVPIDLQDRIIADIATRGAELIPPGGIASIAGIAGASILQVLQSIIRADGPGPVRVPVGVK